MGTGTLLLWILSGLLVLGGLAGSLLPLLPGPILVLAGLWLAAALDGFQRVGWLPMTVITLLAVAAWLLDHLAGLLGAKRAGAGRWALAGAALGTVIGLFMGLVGVFVLPMVGAALGDYLERRRQEASEGVGPDARRALKVGAATVLGQFLGMALQLGLALAMVGLFALAWWW